MVKFSIKTSNIKIVTEVKCFEAKEEVGGMWYYQDINKDNHDNLKDDIFYKQYGALSGYMYENLVTNIPKCMM